MQGTHHVIGCGRQDGASLNQLALRIVPALSQAGEGEQSLIAWPVYSTDWPLGIIARSIFVERLPRQASAEYTTPGRRPLLR
jgi:hypothetical protein